MAVAPLLPQLFGRATDANSETLSGARLYAYAAGTSTPKNTYRDAALATPHAHPVVADSGGSFADIFLATGAYRLVLTDSAGVTIGTRDSYTATPVGPTSLFKTGTYAVTTSDGSDVLIAADASGGAFTITLYTAAGNAGRRVCIKKTDRSAHAVIIDGSSEDTIDGARTVTLSQPYDVVWMESDGTRWHAIVPANDTTDETHSAPSISAGTLTLDLDVSRVFRVSLDADITTLTLAHVPDATRRAIIEVQLTGDGTARTFVWLTGTVRWPGGVAPTLTSTAGQRDWFVLWTDDGGTTWFGSVVGQDY